MENNFYFYIINLNHLPMSTIEIVVIVVTGFYEVLSRVIPTSKTWSIIGNIINLLKHVSDYFDVKK